MVSALPIHLIANQKYHTLSLHETKTHRLLNLKKVLFLRNNFDILLEIFGFSEVFVQYF